MVTTEETIVEGLARLFKYIKVAWVTRKCNVR